MLILFDSYEGDNFKKENFVCLQDRVVNIVAGVVTGVAVAVSTAVMIFANVTKSACKHSVSGCHDCFYLVYYSDL